MREPLGNPVDPVYVEGMAYVRARLGAVLAVLEWAVR
ncbi:hypothetical protein ACTIVE_3087 [Actinomadura verrucosospora]|uniref:Uncharacterized protein n=1 Tax=Actinomadura verrucosospora TaxID=46165 RepID=A0A7D4ANU0_ACTVE|nr:hypothetical protein ACTIVE_3087 [Actinomadura verrucosospora]